MQITALTAIHDTVPFLSFFYLPPAHLFLLLCQCSEAVFYKVAAASPQSQERSGPRELFHLQVGTRLRTRKLVQ